MPSLIRRIRYLSFTTLALFGAGAFTDISRNALPPPSPKLTIPAAVLFTEDFSEDLSRWKADREGVWKITRGTLRAELPDLRQERSFLYAGSESWTDYAVDLDVCMMRGVDKGVVVRAEGDQGIAVDMRGPGYQDLLLQRREWPMGRAQVANGNSVWHHLRVEAQGHTYRVFVNGRLEIEKADGKRSRTRGGIALAAYTGGGGECTVYYDNVVVTPLDSRVAPR